VFLSYQSPDIYISTGNFGKCCRHCM